ncbi:MAG: DUF4058 family protein, partial [Caldilineaceae bacterium]|nr:DUF4058 family protein [Caldilineaceae bacterium]
MPSPFPGMDPYLEGSLWTTLHFTLAAEIVRQIAPRLRPKYVALPVERYALEITRGADRSSAGIYPDVGVAQVQLSRVEDRPVSLVWPILLNQSLPTVPIPLLAGDDDVHFDLQVAFTASYELLGYELLINYTAPPEISLNQTEARLASEF